MAALRRALSLSSTLLARHHLHHYRSLATAANTLSSLLTTTTTTTDRRPRVARRCFHSTRFFSKQFHDVDKIDPDEILFEGCDYKHWLIVMDFPNDPQQRPSSEEMVETYVQTLAKVIGSVEEAKKRMYACSTTTYTGFQAEMDEETSKKFEGMPGVLFVLPDSYIDPVNKEYGGDKYINGTIIPRPPPVQYGRVRRGSRHNNQSPRGQMPNQQGNPAYNQNPADGRGYTPQQGFPRQGFTPQQGHPPQQGFPQQGFPPQQGHPPQQGFPPQQGHPPQQGFLQQGFPPQQGFSQQQGVPPQQNYGPPGQGVRENHMNTGVHYPNGGRNAYPSGGNNYMPSHQGNYNQGYNNPGRLVNNHAGNHMGYAPQGQTRFSGNNRNHDSPLPGRGPYGQTGFGSFDQGEAGQYGTPPGGSYDKGTESGDGPGYGPRGENQTFAQTPDEHGNSMSTEQRNHSPTAYTGMNQGRY